MHFFLFLFIVSVSLQYMGVHFFVMHHAYNANLILDVILAALLSRAFSVYPICIIVNYYFASQDHQSRLAATDTESLAAQGDGGADASGSTEEQPLPRQACTSCCLSALAPAVPAEPFVPCAYQHVLCLNGGIRGTLTFALAISLPGEVRSGAVKVLLHHYLKPCVWCAYAVHHDLRHDSFRSFCL